MKDLLEQALMDIIDKLHSVPGDDDDKHEGMEDMLGGNKDDGDDSHKSGIEMVKVMGDKPDMGGGDEPEEDHGGSAMADLMKKKLMGK